MATRRSVRERKMRFVPRLSRADGESLMAELDALAGDISDGERFLGRYGRMISHSSRAGESCTKKVSRKEVGCSLRKAKSTEGDEVRDGVTIAHIPRMADTTPY